MNILHIGLDSHYTEGMTYQDQMLAEQSIHDGHNVIYISDCNKFDNGILVSTSPENTILKSKINIIRPKFMRYKHNRILCLWSGIRYIKKIIYNTNPNIIYCHHPRLIILILIALKNKHIHSKIYYDYHIDKYNSQPSNVLFKILSKISIIIYRNFLKMTYPYVDKIFYIWGGTREYIIKNYHIPESKLEFYPLGGILPTIDEYNLKRDEIRDELGIQNEDILLIHTGKLDKNKRTEDIIESFSEVKYSNLKLIIIGHIPKNMENTLLPLIGSDSRINYLGWKDADELKSYLCAGDIYVQLGSASATMQIALCCGCPVLLNPLGGYYNEFMIGNGRSVTSKSELICVLREIVNNNAILEDMKDKTWDIAINILDYKKLAARLYK